MTDAPSGRVEPVGRVPNKVARIEHPDEVAPVRLVRLTPEIGWLLITAGVVGVILPGLPGTPFLVVGLLVVTPGGTRRLSRWIGKNPGKTVRCAMKHLDRFLDDLEHRYPKQGNGR